MRGEMHICALTETRSSDAHRHIRGALPPRPDSAILGPRLLGLPAVLLLEGRVAMRGELP